MVARPTAVPRVRTRKRLPAEVTVDTETRERSAVTSSHSDTSHPDVEIESLQPVAKIRVEGSATMNLGDFNSVRVGVAIELPCLPDEESVEAAYQRCAAFVDTKIEDELNKASGKGGEENG